MDILNKDGPTLKMMWKMYLDKNKEFKILDVNIDGVSMLVTQRAEFLSVIKNHPNGVKGLIDAMNKKTTGSWDEIIGNEIKIDKMHITKETLDAIDSYEPGLSKEILNTLKQNGIDHEMHDNRL